MTQVNAQVARPTRTTQQVDALDIDSMAGTTGLTAGAQSVATQATDPNDPVYKIRQVVGWGCTKLVGRDQLMWDLALALVGSTNCLFIGPPGTAKTMAVELVASALCPADQYFSTMLTKFTKPNEVFGPIDLQKLEQGQLHSNTAGFLPTAYVGVLDEIFKGSSAILNSMLTIANERRYKNGAHWEACNTRLLVGMSNEFPEDQVMLAAFYDRFPIKRMVLPVEDKTFAAMLGKTVANTGPNTCPVQLTPADISELDRRREAVQVPAAVLGALADIRRELAAKKVAVSDRRWVQALRCMRASAVLGGRTILSNKDLTVLKSICWNTEADIPIVDTVVDNYCSPVERDLKEIMAQLVGERDRILKASDDASSSGNHMAVSRACGSANNRVKQAATKVAALKANLGSSDPEYQRLCEVETAVQVFNTKLAEILNGTQDVTTFRDLDLKGYADTKKAN